MMIKETSLTGYPSIDKPWLKWYKSDINKLPECDDTSVYYRLKQLSQDRLKKVAIKYFGRFIWFQSGKRILQITF